MGTTIEQRWIDGELVLSFQFSDGTTKRINLTRYPSEIDPKTVNPEPESVEQFSESVGV